MLSINKTDYKSWPSVYVTLRNCTVLDLYAVLKDTVYVVERTEGKYLDVAVKDTDSDLDMLLSVEDSEKEIPDESDCAEIEFVPFENLNIRYSEGRIYITYIQYDYVKLRTESEIKKALRYGCVSESGFYGLRCNKAYKEQELWNYKQGWLVDKIELVKPTEDGSYKRVIVCLEGTIHFTECICATLCQSYLKASYITMYDVIHKEQKGYDKDYSRLKGTSRKLLHTYAIKYDKHTDMTSYKGKTGQLRYLNNTEVYQAICKLQGDTDVLDIAKRDEYVESYLCIGNASKRNRLLYFDCLMLNLMLSEQFRQSIYDKCITKGYWFYKYKLGIDLFIILKREWFECYK